MPENQATDVGFAEFVAALLVETLDSIVASHAGQEERLRALEAAASLTAEQVAAEAITTEMVDAALRELAPDDDGGTTVVPGGPLPDQDLLAELDVALRARDRSGSTLTDHGVRVVRDGVALLLARRHLASVREVSRRGIPRVLVDGGTLRAKLAFSTRRAGAPVTDEAADSSDAADSAADADVAAATDRTRAGMVVPRLVAAAGLREPILRPQVLDSIRDLRLVVRPPEPQAGGEPGGTVDIFGEVELRFRTEVD